jgi:hypothetical protein
VKARPEFVVTQGRDTSSGSRALKRIYVAPSGETEIAILEPPKVRAVKGSGLGDLSLEELATVGEP